MVAPTVRSVAVTDPDSFSTDVDVDLPATVESGDVIYVAIQRGAGGAADFTGTPAGFTQRVSVTSANSRHWVFTKEADGTEDSTTVTFNSSGNRSWTAVALAIAGAVETPHKSNNASTTFNTSQAVPQLTTTVDDCLVVGSAGTKDLNGVTMPTTGWTLQGGAETTATADNGIEVSTHVQTTAGTTTGGNATIGTEDVIITTALAFEPAAGGGSVDADVATTSSRTVTRTVAADATATVVDTTVDATIATTSARTVSRTVAADADVTVVSNEVNATITTTSARTVTRTVAADADVTVVSNVVNADVETTTARTVSRTVTAAAVVDVATFINATITATTARTVARTVSVAAAGTASEFAVGAPAGRTLTVAAEPRTLTVAAESRTLEVAQDA